VLVIVQGQRVSLVAGIQVDHNCVELLSLHQPLQCEGASALLQLKGGKNVTQKSSLAWLPTYPCLGKVVQVVAQQL